MTHNCAQRRRLVLIVAGWATLAHLILLMMHPSLKILVHFHVSPLLDRATGLLVHILSLNIAHHLWSKSVSLTSPMHIWSLLRISIELLRLSYSSPFLVPLSKFLSLHHLLGTKLVLIWFLVARLSIVKLGWLPKTILSTMHHRHEFGLLLLLLLALKFIGLLLLCSESDFALLQELIIIFLLLRVE